jgi:hypothetical protein
MSTKTEPLETLKRLRQQVDNAIGCIELGQVREDPNSTARPFDFRLGDFGVVDLAERERRRIENDTMSPADWEFFAKAIQAGARFKLVKGMVVE